MNSCHINSEIDSLKSKFKNNIDKNIQDFPIIIDGSERHLKKLYFKRNCKTNQEYIKCQIDFFYTI